MDLIFDLHATQISQSMKMCTVDWDRKYGLRQKGGLALEVMSGRAQNFHLKKLNLTLFLAIFFLVSLIFFCLTWECFGHWYKTWKRKSDLRQCEFTQGTIKWRTGLCKNRNLSRMTWCHHRAGQLVCYIRISNGWTSHLLFFAVVKNKEHLQQSLVYGAHILFTVNTVQIRIRCAL